MYKFNFMPTHIFKLEGTEGGLHSWCHCLYTKYVYTKIGMSKYSKNCISRNVRCYEVKQRKVKRPAIGGNQTQDTGLVQSEFCIWATTTGPLP